MMSRARFSRRAFLGAAGVLAGAALPNLAMADDTVTLDVYVHDNHPFDRVKPLFEAQYPNIKLNMIRGNDLAFYRATLAAKGAGAPDITWLTGDVVQELGKTGVLLDVADIVTPLKSDLAAGATAACFISASQTYAAFPGEIAAIGLYYRQDLLDQAGVAVPDEWTWDEFAEAAKAVKAKTGATSLIIPTTGTTESALLWSYILNQLGGAITSADGTEVTLDDEKGVAAMEQAKRLYQAGIALDAIFTSEDFFAEVAAGHVAMAPLEVGYRGFGIEPNVTDETSGLGQWRVALLPSAGPGSARSVDEGGAAIVSTIYTKHAAEVKTFMAFALGTMEGAKACADWGIVPPYLPYLKSADWSAARSPAFGDFAFNEVWASAVDQIPDTWRRLPVFGEAMAAVGAAILPMLDGSVEPAAGLKTVGDQVRELNKRHQ
jgi:ABC-type glycerol-3-phosphate transport system substrate-binding protein